MPEIKKHCAVCLTEENLGSHFTHYHVTCKDHKQYGEVYLIELVQKELGYIKEYSEKMKFCFVCEVKLTDGEIEGIKKTDYVPLCNKHLEVREWYQFYKQWFEFKISFPNANKDIKEDYKKFIEWLFEHKKL